MQYAHRTLRLNEKVHDFSVRVRFSNPTARPGDSLFSTRTPRRDRQHIGFTPVSICWRTGGHELLGLVADARVGLGNVHREARCRGAATGLAELLRELGADARVGLGGGVGGSLSPPAFGLQVLAGRRSDLTSSYPNSSVSSVPTLGSVLGTCPGRHGAGAWMTPPGLPNSSMSSVPTLGSD